LTVATPFQNLGSLETDGFELQGHWGLPALEGRLGGKFYVDTALTWLRAYRVQLLPGAPVFDYTGVSVGNANPGGVPPRAAPDLRALTTLGFKGNALGAGLRWRYQSSMDDVSAVLTPNNVQPGVPSYSLWDLFASWKFGDSVELRGGVNNLLDKEPPFVASSQTGIDVALYDVVGRSYYIGLRASF
jgi:iron complex outermembrane recepter protein